MKRTVTVIMGLALMLLVLGVVAQAQQAANVAGTWELTAPGRGGPQVSTLTIEQKGTALTGTLKGAQGDPAPLTGTVAGNNVTFSVKRAGRNGEQVIEYKGELDGGALKGKVTMGQNEVEWTAKKSGT
jgi:hypothetical protein